jgi:hypothetical protein
MVADRLQFRRGQPVGLVLERVRDQAEGVPGLPAGELVRPVLPVRGHAEPPLLVFGQAGERLVNAGQVRGPPVRLGQAHAGQQGADAQLPGAHSHREHGLDPRRGPGGVDDLLPCRERDHRRPPPSSLTASASPAGSRPATRSPSRWEHLIRPRA